MSPLHSYIHEKKIDHTVVQQSQRRSRIRFFLRIEGVVAVFFILSAVILQFALSRESRELAQLPAPTPQVRGVSTEAVPTATPTQTPTTTPTPTPTPLPTPTPTPLSKPFYKIALFGDSMIDSMGTDLRDLNEKLIKKYPRTSFSIFNYGKGSENLDMANERFEHELHYENKNYPSIPDIKPDVIIVGSYAYNPFSPYDRDRHWVGLTALVKQAQKWSSSVYLLAEIAPEARLNGSDHITEQLQNAVSLSRALGVPLIDVYHASLTSQNQGDKKYISSTDGIHPSDKGKELTADKIVDALKLK